MRFTIRALLILTLVVALWGAYIIERPGRFKLLGDYDRPAAGTPSSPIWCPAVDDKALWQQELGIRRARFDHPPCGAIPDEDWERYDLLYVPDWVQIYQRGGYLILVESSHFPGPSNPIKVYRIAQNQTVYTLVRGKLQFIDQCVVTGLLMVGFLVVAFSFRALQGKAQVPEGGDK